jgi:hypothetical protein
VSQRAPLRSSGARLTVADCCGRRVAQADSWLGGRAGGGRAGGGLRGKTAGEPAPGLYRDDEILWVSTPDAMKAKTYAIPKVWGAIDTLVEGINAALPDPLKWTLGGRTPTMLSRYSPGSRGHSSVRPTP